MDACVACFLCHRGACALACFHFHAQDDNHIRIFNYNTQEKVHSFEAHGDYIRSIAVHPSQPFVLSCSDDMQIKLWNWEKNWECTQVLEGHTHYVMCVVFNPKDTNTFASASLDQSIKVCRLDPLLPFTPPSSR
jgi:coatomer subunit beta'